MATDAPKVCCPLCLRGIADTLTYLYENGEKPYPNPFKLTPAYGYRCVYCKWCGGKLRITAQLEIDSDTLAYADELKTLARSDKLPDPGSLIAYEFGLDYRIAHVKGELESLTKSLNFLEERLKMDKEFYQKLLGDSE